MICFNIAILEFKICFNIPIAKCAVLTSCGIIQSSNTNSRTLHAAYDQHVTNSEHNYGLHSVNKFDQR